MHIRNVEDVRMVMENVGAPKLQTYELREALKVCQANKLEAISDKFAQAISDEITRREAIPIHNLDQVVKLFSNDDLPRLDERQLLECYKVLTAHKYEHGAREVELRRKANWIQNAVLVFLVRHHTDKMLRAFDGLEYVAKSQERILERSANDSKVIIHETKMVRRLTYALLFITALTLIEPLTHFIKEVFFNSH